jgi:iron complex transport system substrate-binding protein
VRKPAEPPAQSIVSLAPSATATLDALGATDLLVGVTTHCDGDIAAPVVGGWLNPQYDQLEEVDPDVICTSDPLQRDVRDELEARGFRVHHVEPTTLPEVLDSFVSIADAVDRRAEGETLRNEAETRLQSIEARVADEPRPVVYCEEWSDPPMAAGNWVPEAVEVAGGRCPFVPSGERSREIDESAVVDANPEYAILHLCGRGNRVDASVIDGRGWAIDPEVHVVDDSLLNQPSPRLVNGIETLASILH